MLLLSFAILSSMRVLGVTLIAAALVIPPVIARMLTDSFARMLVLSTSIGAIAGVTGMYLSYHLDISSGAAIVLVNFAGFVVVYTITGSTGLGHIAAVRRRLFGSISRACGGTRPRRRPAAPSGR
jgi:manganese/iron transport system permease protein/iron/zinc/copper transport system permease protein